MKQKIYIDTSIVGGYFDDEFDEETRALFDRLVNKEVIFVVSDLLEQELIKAPQHVKELLNKFDADSIEKVILTEEAKILANTYISEKIISRKYMDDSQHIAIATINKVDVLAS